MTVGVTQHHLCHSPWPPSRSQASPTLGGGDYTRVTHSGETVSPEGVLARGVQKTVTSQAAGVLGEAGGGGGGGRKPELEG